MGRVVRGRYEVVAVTGPEARGFLDSLLSQDLAKLEPGVALRSFLLSPQGRLRALLWVAGHDQQVDLYADTGLGERVASDLRNYKIRIKAGIGTPEPAFAYLDEPTTDTVAAPLGERRRGLGRNDPGWEEIPPGEWEGARIEAGEPVMDRDLDEKTIPQETGLVEEAVSFTKGCYLGQELVARIDSRHGRVNRHLRRVELSGPVEVPVTVTFGDEEVGSMTSAGRSGDRHLGLGLLHRRVESGDTVAVGEIEGRVL